MRTRYAFGLSSAALVAAIVLASCGGGGGSGPQPPAKATATPTPAPLPCLSGSSASRSIVSRSRATSSLNGRVNPNRLYVTYRASAAGRATESIDRSVSAARVVDFGVEGTSGHRLVSLSSAMDAATATAALRQNPDVIDVAPTHFRAISATGFSTCDVVNDPFANTTDQWYLYVTNTTPGGWRATKGSSAISVAVIDTGVDESRTDTLDFVIDFQESIVNTETPADSTAAGAAQDTNGHGTNVSGLATALANNGFGFAGVGYSTHLQIYRIFPQTTAASDQQSADTGDEATAIRHAVANGAAVINLSLGSPNSTGADPAEQSAINFALAANVIVVAANGNEFLPPSPDSNLPDFPAAYPGVIAVGASAVTDNKDRKPINV